MDEIQPTENENNISPTSHEASSDGPLKSKKSGPQKMVGILMLEAGTEFVFLIAVPLIAGVLAGKWLDNKYNHHFFVIIGILLGIAVSAIAVYKRIMDYKRMLK